MTDLNSTNRQFDALEARASAFSRLLENQVGHALDSLLVKGSGLQAVMDNLYGNLRAVVTQLAVINPTLNAAFGDDRRTLASPSAGLLGGLTSGLTGGLESAFSGLFNGAASPASSAATGSPVTVNIQTANAQSFAASEAQVSAAIADAVRRGQTLR